MKNLRVLFVTILGLLNITLCYSQFYTVIKKERLAVIHSLNEDSTVLSSYTGPLNFTRGSKNMLPSERDVERTVIPHEDNSTLLVSVPDSTETLSEEALSGEPELSEGGFFHRLFSKKGRKASKKEEFHLSDSLVKDLRGEMLLCAPLDSLILTSGFGYRTDPFSGKRKFHYGADYRTASENVYVMMPGKITKIGYNKVLGNYVTLEHGDFTVTYAHLHTVAGDKGQLVKAGQSVGISGSTGRSMGEHLHIAMRFKNKVIDPHPLVQYIAETSRLSQGTR